MIIPRSKETKHLFCLQVAGDRGRFCPEGYIVRTVAAGMF